MTDEVMRLGTGPERECVGGPYDGRRMALPPEAAEVELWTGGTPVGILNWSAKGPTFGGDALSIDAPRRLGRYYVCAGCGDLHWEPAE